VEQDIAIEVPQFLPTPEAGQSQPSEISIEVPQIPSAQPSDQGLLEASPLEQKEDHEEEEEEMEEQEEEQEEQEQEQEEEEEKEEEEEEEEAEEEEEEEAEDDESDDDVDDEKDRKARIPPEDEPDDQTGLIPEYMIAESIPSLPAVDG